MARPERNNVDYFPFYCEEGKKMFFLEETYGNDGFAVFIKLLRELAKTNFHYLDLSKKSTTMFLSAKCKVSIEILDNIIQDLVDLEKFNKILWEENRIIWCQDFVDSIQDAYSRRKNNCINFNGLLLLLTRLGIRKPLKESIIDPINTQSIVKYSKEEESKKNNSKEENALIFPTFEDFWDLYDKKVGKKEKIKKKWVKLPQKTKEEIIKYIPLYINSQPQKKYRKNPETFLNNESWKDEIINVTDEKTNSNQKGGASPEFRKKTAERLGIIQP